MARRCILLNAEMQTYSLYLAVSLSTARFGTRIENLNKSTFDAKNFIKTTDQLPRREQALVRGYKVGPQVLRAAMVVVSSGPGPAADAAPTSANADAEPAPEAADV